MAARKKKQPLSPPKPSPAQAQQLLKKYAQTKLTGYSTPKDEPPQGMSLSTWAKLKEAGVHGPMSGHPRRVPPDLVGRNIPAENLIAVAKHNESKFLSKLSLQARERNIRKSPEIPLQKSRHEPQKFIDAAHTAMVIKKVGPYPVHPRLAPVGDQARDTIEFARALDKHEKDSKAHFEARSSIHDQFGSYGGIIDRITNGAKEYDNRAKTMQKLAKEESDFRKHGGAWSVKKYIEHENLKKSAKAIGKENEIVYPGKPGDEPIRTQIVHDPHSNTMSYHLKGSEGREAAVHITRSDKDTTPQLHIQFVKNGEVVHEHEDEGHSPSPLQKPRSVLRSVMTAGGRALDHTDVTKSGKQYHAIGQHLASFLHGHSEPELPKDEHQMQLAHLPKSFDDEIERRQRERDAEKIARAHIATGTKP